jgi:hypothetical protein
MRERNGNTRQVIDWVAEIGLGYLCNVFTDLLGRETKRPDLGRKGSGRADFAASCSEVEDLDLVGIEFWRHCCRDLGM